MKNTNRGVFLAIGSKYSVGLLLLATVFAVPASSESPDSYRLDGSVLPNQYQIRIVPNLDDEVFSGEVKILVTAQNETDVITLHATDITFNSIAVSHIKETETEVYEDIEDNRELDDERQLVHLKLKEGLVPCENYSITIKYDGKFQNDMYGFYISTYYDDSGTQRKLATTQFQPTHARKAFPCFDEPSYKARFEITIVDPEGYESLSNMPTSSKKDNENKFQNSVVMSTYLVAFVVSDYTKRGKEEKGIQYTTWVRENALNTSAYSLEVTPKLLQALEEYTDVPYADLNEDVHLTKVDQVAIPDFSAGAMENWGLITYRESILLFNNGSQDNRKQTAMVIAHELAHMWFGNLVTTKWWAATWLNEGFANYFQSFATSLAEPEFRMMEQYVVDHVQAIMETDAVEGTLPLTHSINTPEEASARFFQISYSKGGSLLRMINSMIGEKKFQKTLQTYLKKYKYSSVDPEDLFEEIKRHAIQANLTPEEMEEFLQLWTTKAGFPVVTVNRDYDSRIATVTQKRFLYRGESELLYYVPLTWTQQGRYFDIWKPKQYLKPTEPMRLIENMPGPEFWIIFNVQETGYYRVNYDERNWNLIINYLKNYNHPLDNIHVLNRAQLLDDAFNLARADLLPYATAFELATYLPREHDYVPWAAALSAFSFLDRMFASNGRYPIFQKHVRRLLDGQYARFDFGSHDPENLKYDERQLLNRITSRACAMGHELCNSKAAEELVAFIDDEKYIHPDLRSVVFCHGIKNKNEYWEGLWNVYNESLDDAERARLVSGLACSTNGENLKKFLGFAVDGKHVRKQDAASVFSAVYATPLGAKFALEFLSEEENFNKTRDYISITSVVSGIANRFTTVPEKNKLEEFLSKYKEYLGNTTSFSTIVQNNIDWISEHGEHLLTYLEKDDGGYRLPDTVTAHRYMISLAPDFDTGRFEGNVTIYVETLAVTDAITLHASGLEIKNISVYFEIRSNIPYDLYDSHSVDPERDFLHIYLIENVHPGGYYVTIHYVGMLRNDMYGFYNSTYKTGEEERFLAATQFQPTHARRAFPCLDEPHIKATFDIGIFNPPGRWTLSNMPEQYISVWDDERVQSKFFTSMRMSTYLVAFVVSDFAYVEDKKDGEVLFRTWARPDALPWAQYSLQVSRPILNALEDYTNIKYTSAHVDLNKIDQVAIPDFSAGAMENWGLITYRETALLYNDGPASAKRRVATTIAHELVHMWFGNLVTTKSWDSTWLNEGFAQYFQYYATDKVETTWRIMDQFLVDVHQVVFRSDMLASAEALTSSAHTPAQISARFGTITYSKGASFIRMLKSVIGDTALQQALRSYLSENTFRATAPQDLFDKIIGRASTSGLSVDQMQEFLVSWTEQPGFPLVTVTREYSTNRATVTQKRFLSIEDSNDTTLYYVPLTWTKQGEGFEDRRPQGFIPNDAASAVVSDMPDADSWVIFNVQETGYYRVNYDKENWALLARHLAQGAAALDAVHVLNRAQLLDDAFNLARGDHLPYATAFAIADYLEHEADFVPWTAAATAFNFLDVMLASHEKYNVFQTYILHLLHNQYERFRFEDRDSNGHQEKLHLNRISNLACSHGHEHCRESAEKMLVKYIEKNETVSSDLRSVVYCYGIRDSPEHWDELWEKYTKSKDDAERALIATGLGCSTDPDTLKKYLQHSISGKDIRRQDASSIFTAVYTTHFGVEVALEFLEEKFSEIRQYYGSMGSINSITTGIAARLTTESQMKKLENFVFKYSNELGASGKAALETVQANLNWLEENAKEIIDILESKIDSISSTKDVKIVQKQNARS